MVAIKHINYDQLWMLHRAMYAEKHYNYKSDLDKRLNQLHGLKSYNVTIKQEGSSKGDSFKLTPYHYLNLFGEDNLNKYKNVKKVMLFRFRMIIIIIILRLKITEKHLQIMMLNKP